MTLNPTKSLVSFTFLNCLAAVVMLAVLQVWDVRAIDLKYPIRDGRMWEAIADVSTMMENGSSMTYIATIEKTNIIMLISAALFGAGHGCLLWYLVHRGGRSP